RGERVVRACDLEGRRTVDGARVQLVLRPAIRTGVEVAARAGLNAVAAELHVPEERLTERDGRRLVTDEEREVRGFRNRNGFERWGRRGQHLGSDGRAQQSGTKHGRQ